MNTANSAAIIAPPPPPPAIRGLISRAIFAGILAALFLAAAPPAEAQVTRTITLSATNNNGDRDPVAPGLQVDEGDRVTITYRIDGLTDGSVSFPDVGYPFGGDAIAGSDFTVTNRPDHTIGFGTFLTFLQSGSQELRIADDSIAESDETITLAVPTNFNYGGSDTIVRGDPLTITIRANDGPVFSIAVDETARNEGQTAVFTVTLGGDAPTGAVTVDWAISGDATAGDYTLTGADTDGTLSFTALGSQTLNFAITDDELREDAETLTVTLRNPSTGSIIGTASATTTIAESDQPHAHSFVFTNPAATITEGAAATTYTVTRTGPDITGSITVTWAYAAATPAPVAADFHNDTLPAGGTLEFTGSETSETFTVRTKEDTLNEAGERFTLTLSIASAHEAAATAEGGAGVPAAHTVTITDDDPITATVTGSASVNEGATVATGVTVTLTGGTSTEAVVIAYNNADATGSLTIAAGMTTGMLSLTAVDDDISEGSEPLSLMADDFTATSAGAVTVAVSGAPTLTINADADDDISVTIAAPAAANTGRAAEFTVRMSGASAAAVTVAYSVTLTVDGANLSGRVTATPANSLTIAAGDTSGAISVAIPADVNVAEMGALTVTLTPGGVSVATGGGTADLGTPATATVAVSSDDPAARGRRLEAPLAAAARGIGQLAAHAIARRATSAGNNLTLAGRGIANAETIPAALLAGGRETTMKELLHQSGFAFTAGDSGLNFWGGGERINAEGDADGVSYDGGTTAFHLGMDTQWRDGLIGIAAANSAGDLDLTAAGMTSALETNVTSVHPYLVRRLNNSRLWTTLGYGSGDAEIREPGGVNIKTDLTVLTAAFSIAHAQGETLSASVGALYSRATLDAAQSAGRRLPKVAVNTLRITAAGEAGWDRGDWRPFVTANLRHDAGDGDTGSAGDLGGGVEWQKATASLRLSGTTHLAGDGPEEDRLTFTARKNAGRLNLGLNLGVHNGVDTANLLSGEWRF